MTTTKKERCRIPQYNIEGKAMEAFLGPLESKILEIIWAYDKLPITVRETYVILNSELPHSIHDGDVHYEPPEREGFLEQESRKGEGRAAVHILAKHGEGSIREIRC